MSDNILKAKRLLDDGNYTCVLCKDSVIYTSSLRGVKPLLDFLDNQINLDGFSAADKVVGKGAAFLYVLLKVKAVYAKVISSPAKEVLESNNIDVTFDVLTDAIVNRDNTGLCPIESAVMEISSAKDALNAIRKKLQEISK